MDISLQDINSVDKEVIITADREDLEPKFQEAYKKYKKQINMPGFRPGKVPVEIVRKRFGDEIEQEEVGNYVQEVFENEVVPEYEPVGEPEMLDLTWEDDKLEAKFKVGLRPEFELADLEDATVDLMVHDVTDEEVEHELEHALEREGNWEEVEEPVTENSKVTVDAVHLDEDGEPIEGETDEDQVIDLRQDEFSAFESDLLGKKAGDIVNVQLGEEEEQDEFKLIIKKVEKLHPAKLTDEFAKEQSNDEAKNVDEYKSLLKSRIQDYYDQSADDLFKNEIVDTLVEKHDFEVPESFLEQVLDQYVQRVEQQAGGDLSDDFNREAYKEQVHDRAVRDAKWYFINEKLQEKFDDIEIESDDVDEHLAAQAAQYGVTVDQMRNMFAQNPQQLENLRNSIREEKVFDRLKDIVNINEMDKETYEQKHEEVNS
ncbi:MAG TPA: trigger factor [Balneolaceae bacterium]|nr:trigger factor [Balneolaceae bacterium]